MITLNSGLRLGFSLVTAVMLAAVVCGLFVCRRTIYTTPSKPHSTEENNCVAETKL
jgi:hypothetical protein